MAGLDSGRRFVASNGVVIFRNSRGRLSMEGAESDYLWEAHEDALREYFANEPKPWHDAKPGEVWVLSIEGRPEGPYTIWDNGLGEMCAYVGDAHGWPVTDPAITAGRRIWPEADES